MELGMRPTPFSKMMQDFFRQRYGRLFARVQMEDGRLLEVGDSVRSIVDPHIVREVVCFFYTDRDEIAFGFTQPGAYDPTAPMWQQEAILSKYEKA